MREALPLFQAVQLLLRASTHVEKDREFIYSTKMGFHSFATHARGRHAHGGVVSLSFGAVKPSADPQTRLAALITVYRLYIVKSVTFLLRTKI